MILYIAVFILVLGQVNAQSCYCFPDRTTFIASCQAEFMGVHLFSTITCDLMADYLASSYPTNDLELISALAFSKYQTEMCDGTPEKVPYCEVWVVDPQSRMNEIRDGLVNIGDACNCT